LLTDLLIGLSTKTTKEEEDWLLFLTLIAEGVLFELTLVKFFRVVFSYSSARVARCRIRKQKVEYQRMLAGRINIPLG